MSFLGLGGLSALGQTLAIAGGAAAVGALVAMYFLKLKRVRREISSTFLWKKSVRDLHANSPFQKLRRNLLLFLQLLILLAVLFALARPAFLTKSGDGVTYILLVDRSASMSATDVSPNRLGAAVAAAGKIISGMSRQDSVMILSFASRPEVVQTLTTDRKAAIAAVRAIKPSHETTDIVEPLRLASSLSENAVNPRIVVISDGAFGKEAAVEALSAPVEFISIGERSRNLAVTAMDVRGNVEDPSIGEIFTKISNSHDEAIQARLTLEVDGKLIDAKMLDVPAGGSQAATFKVRLDAERVAKISIDPDDDLSVDDSAWAILEPPKDVHVVILGSVSPFLRRSLEAGGNFRVSQAAGDAVPVLGETQTPVFVCDGSAPSVLTQAGYLVFDAVVDESGFASEGEMSAPIVIDVNDKHPVTAYLELSDLYIAKARKIKFPPETKVLVNGDQGPLIAVSYVNGARVITVAFDPMQSRWPLRISFPMFITNAINFLASSGQSRSARKIRTGEVLLLSGAPGADKVSVTSPNGSRMELAVDEGATVAYGLTGQVGIYEVESGDRFLRYAANLTDSSESDISPGASLVVGSREVAGERALVLPKREFWRELLLFAFVVMLVEWYIYNRRVYV